MNKALPMAIIKDAYDSSISVPEAARRLGITADRMRHIAKVRNWPKKPSAVKKGAKPLGPRKFGYSIYDSVETV